MKLFVQKIINHPRYAKSIAIGKVITVTSAAQVIIQGIGFISGILIIRLLSTSEYALYTLANTILGTMLLLTDGGISSGLMAQGGKVWLDPVKLGKVFATGFDLRKKFAIVSLFVGLPLLLFFLKTHSDNWLVSLLVVLSIIPAFFSQLSGSLLEIIPKLHQDVIPLQKIQVYTNIVRFLLLSLTLFMFPFAIVAIVITGIPQIWANYRLKKLSWKYLEKTELPDPEIRKYMITIVKRVLPGAVYYCISGQIIIWLASIFGSSKSIASVGALGRLSMIINILLIVFGIVISPRFAKLPNDRNILRKRYLQIQLGLIILSCFIVLIFSFFSVQALWLLGKDYSELNNEVRLSVIGTCLTFIATSSYFLSSSRGWAINPAISIIIELIVIVSAAFVLNLSTLNGIYTLMIGVALVQILINLIYILFKINRTLPVSISY